MFVPTTNKKKIIIKKNKFLHPIQRGGGGEMVADRLSLAGLPHSIRMNPIAWASLYQSSLIISHSGRQASSTARKQLFRIMSYEDDILPPFL
jgi:hypothetical protein